MDEETRNDAVELMLGLARRLTDHPEAVRARAEEAEGSMVIELQADARDIGRLIGHRGRTVQSLELLLAAATRKAHERYTLEVTEA